MFKELNEESYEELKGCIVTMIDKMVDVHKNLNDKMASNNFR